jgi:hypothetical protein
LAYFQLYQSQQLKSSNVQLKSVYFVNLPYLR